MAAYIVRRILLMIPTLFGIMLVFWPIESAVTLVMVGGAFAILFAIGLFGLAWRLHKAGM